MVHKIEIRNKKPGEFQSAQATEILLDGKPLRGVTHLSFDVEAGGMAVCTLSFSADFLIEGNPLLGAIEDQKEELIQKYEDEIWEDDPDDEEGGGSHV
jgi:hypothetical protein